MGINEEKLSQNTTEMQAEDRICNVAFIGAGKMAREHLAAFSDIKRVRLTGIMSRTKSKAENLAREFGILQVVDSIEELAALRPDLLVITVNADQVHEVVKSCANWPWTILAEKPVGLNLRQSSETLACVKNGKAKVFVALNRRFYESTSKMLNGLSQCSGPRFIEVFDQQEPEKMRQIFGHIDPEGLMFGNSIHAIDFFSILGRGDVTSIKPVFKWREKQPLAVCSAITFSSGDYGMYHAVWDAPGPWAVFVTTKEQRWELRPLECAKVQMAGTRILRDIDLGDIDKKFKPGLREQAEHAVSAAMGLPNGCATLEDAHKTMEIVDAIYKS